MIITITNVISTRMGETKNVHRPNIYSKKFKSLLSRPGNRWKDDIQMVLKQNVMIRTGFVW
jgi:hypothetical protein